MDSSNPNLLQWKQTLKNNVAQIDQHTFFVAHSLGCITLLDFLSELDFQQIGGVVCVSGFSNKLAITASSLTNEVLTLLPSLLSLILLV